ncbi:replication endonuclease, partial [Escherichia coli]|nr:replication endonuclease [Escherichia coli]
EGPQRLKDDAMDAVLAAADAGCFATYIEKQGGVLVPRKDYLIRTAYDLADELNDYGEQSVQIYGIWSPLIGESSRVCTHPDNWKLVRRKPEAEDSARENGFDLQGGPAAPWTRGNNCPGDEKTAGTGTENRQRGSRLTLPESGLAHWLQTLTRHERKQLIRQLKNQPPTTDTGQNNTRPASDTPVRVEVVVPVDTTTIAQITRELDALGVQLPDAAIISVSNGARVRPGDGRIAYWSATTRRIVITQESSAEVRS